MASVNLDIAQRLDITCRKGDTFSLTLNITDSAGTAINLSAYTFEMEVRNASKAFIGFTPPRNASINAKIGAVSAPASSIAFTYSSK